MGLLSPGPQPAPEPPEPPDTPAHADASALLKRFNIPHRAVVRVDRDSIMFRGYNGQARTAWIAVRDGRPVAVSCQDGFPAEPSEWIGAYLARQSSPDAGPAHNTD